MNKLFTAALLSLLATSACKAKQDTPAPTPDAPAAEQAAADTTAPDTATQDQANTAPSADTVPDGSADADTPTDTQPSPESKDILSRTPVIEYAMVQHVLISWDEMASTYAARGGQDPRGAERSLSQANELAASVLKRAQDGEDFSALMREVSEDPGSARTGREYNVTPTASLVEPFKALSLRLQPKESGIVASDFGYHVIHRTQ